MLRPSYTDLLDVISQETDDITLGSRYTIVIAAAKRARQLVDHADPLVSNTKVDKPVSIAVNELYQGKIKYVRDILKKLFLRKKKQWKKLLQQKKQKYNHQRKKSEVHKVAERNSEISGFSDIYGKEVRDVRTGHH